MIDTLVLDAPNPQPKVGRRSSDSECREVRAVEDPGATRRARGRNRHRSAGRPARPPGHRRAGRLGLPRPRHRPRRFVSAGRYGPMTLGPTCQRTAATSSSRRQKGSRAWQRRSNIGSTWSFLSKTRRAQEEADLTPARLNELGTQGWEAVGLSLNREGLIARPVLLLKRPVDQPFNTHQRAWNTTERRSSSSTTAALLPFTQGPA